jgi:hypothetical protein
MYTFGTECSEFSRRKGNRSNIASCEHMYINAKMIPVETISGIKGWGDKEG